MKLASRSRIPPGGMRFRHPISGHEESFHSWSRLRSWVTAHCAANGYPPVTDDEIEAQMCSRFGPQAAAAYCEGEGLSVRGIGLHWRELVAGTRVLMAHVFNGRRTVEPEEAERRAGICGPCTRNTDYSRPCGSTCPELEEVIKAIVGGGTTSHDHQLQACAVCGCSNRAQVWVPIEQLSQGNDADFIKNAPDFCWKRAALIELREKQ